MNDRERSDIHQGGDGPLMRGAGRLPSADDGATGPLRRGRKCGVGGKIPDHLLFPGNVNETVTYMRKAAART